MIICTHQFKNTWTSSSHANFRFNIFHSKTLSYSFWGRENSPKTDKTCNIFSYLNICLHNNIFICLHIVYEHTHLTPGTSRLLSKHFCLQPLSPKDPVSLLCGQQSFPFDVCNQTCTHQHMCHQFDVCKKQHVPLLFMTLIVWDIQTRKMNERKKNIKFNS